jgi:hypothetical protein
VLDDDAAGEQAGVLLPTALPADALLLRWQRANDACFAGDSSAGPAGKAALLRGDADSVVDAAPVTDAAAAVALAFAMGGWWGAQPTETEQRKRQRFLSRSI